MMTPTGRAYQGFPSVIIATPYDWNKVLFHLRIYFNYLSQSSNKKTGKFCSRRKDGFSTEKSSIAAEVVTRASTMSFRTIVYFMSGWHMTWRLQRACTTRLFELLLWPSYWRCNDVAHNYIKRYPIVTLKVFTIIYKYIASKIVVRQLTSYIS